MKIQTAQGFKYFKDDNMGNVYILKRNQGYCLSRFQSLASLDDMLELNGEFWFNTLKEIKAIINSNYNLED